MGNGAAVTTQRALYYVIFFFCVLACFMHNRVPSLFDWLFRFITFCFVIIYFKDEQSPVFAVLAEVYLPIYPPATGKISRLLQTGQRNMVGFSLRTILYEHPVQKLVQ